MILHVDGFDIPAMKEIWKAAKRARKVARDRLKRWEGLINTGRYELSKLAMAELIERARHADKECNRFEKWLRASHPHVLETAE